MERINDTVDPRRVPGVIRRMWEGHRVIPLGVDPAGREICQVADVLLLVYRSNRKTVVVTVLGKAQETGLIPEGIQMADTRDQVRWRRKQRLQSVGQIHRTNWQERRR